MRRIQFVFTLLVLATSGDLFAKNIEVHGHRGARGVRPENTLSAFQYALDVGVDVLEMDLQVTKDNHLIVAHDQKVDQKICKVPSSLRRSLRTSRKSSKSTVGKNDIVFRSLTLQQVKQLDCGSLRNKRFPKQKLRKGERIPTLDEVFKLVKGSPLKSAKKVRFNIEMKSIPILKDWAPAPKEFAKLVIENLKKNKMDKRSVLQSFDHRILQEVKEIDDSIPLVALTEYNRVDYVAALKGVGASILSPSFHWITKEDVAQVQEAGFRVIPWTANEEREWEYLVQVGVDGIITDYPKELIYWLQRKKLR